MTGQNSVLSQKYAYFLHWKGKTDGIESCFFSFQ